LSALDDRDESFVRAPKRSAISVDNEELILISNLQPVRCKAKSSGIASPEGGALGVNEHQVSVGLNGQLERGHTFSSSVGTPKSLVASTNRFEHHISVALHNELGLVRSSNDGRGGSERHRARC